MNEIKMLNSRKYRKEQKRIAEAKKQSAKEAKNTEKELKNIPIAGKGILPIELETYNEQKQIEQKKKNNPMPLLFQQATRNKKQKKLSNQGKKRIKKAKTKRHFDHVNYPKNKEWNTSNIKKHIGYDSFMTKWFEDKPTTTKTFQSGINAFLKKINKR